MDSKFCKVCGYEKPLDAFYDNVNLKSGKENICKACKKIAARESRENKNKGVKKSRTAEVRNVSSFRLHPMTLKRIERTRAELALSSFTETIEYIMLKSTRRKLYFKSNGFSKATAVLDRNLMELATIFKNLNLLRSAVSAGRITVNDADIDAINELIDRFMALQQAVIDALQSINAGSQIV